MGAHHVEAIRRTGYGDAVALVGSDRERAAACARRLRVPRATTELAAVLSDPSIDVVHVCLALSGADRGWFAPRVQPGRVRILRRRAPGANPQHGDGGDQTQNRR
jgi:hypothetical protein